MISYQEGNLRFNYRVAGVCIHKESVLLHKVVTDDFWALPGGRAELLEFSPQTLLREMKEELNVEVHVGQLLWIAENFFNLDGVCFHEFSLYYAFEFPEGHAYYQSNEFPGIEEDGRLLFKWHPVTELMDTRLFPTFLREHLNNLPKTTAHILHQDGITKHSPY